MAEKISVRKMRRLRPLLAKHYALPAPPDPKESYLDRVVLAVLWQDTPPARARAAFEALAKEFVDWNDLRVSVASDVAAVMEACGVSGVKAAVLKRILGKGVEDLYSLEFERLCGKSREQIKTWFIGVEGIPHSTGAFVLYNVYGYDRVLVDPDIARVVQRLGLVSETATEEEIEAALAEVVPAREARSTYYALREHALKVCSKKDFNCRTCPLRKESDTGIKRIAEEDAAARAAKKAMKKAAPKPKAAPKKPATPRAKAAKKG